MTIRELLYTLVDGHRGLSEDEKAEARNAADSLANLLLRLRDQAFPPAPPAQTNQE